MESPTTEVAMVHTLRDDLYVVVGSINPQTKVASFQIHINPLVSWIWLGCMILIFGSIVTMWPEVVPEESTVWAIARAAAATAASVAFGIVLAMMPAPAFAQSSSMHSGTVRIDNERERLLFNGMRCMCGGCERLPLASCGCADAEQAREWIRAKIAAGESNDAILLAYRNDHGSDALTVPPNAHGMQAIYAVPIVGIGMGAVGVVMLVRRWNKTGKKPAKKPKKKPERDAYDDRLDEELRDLDDV